MHTVSGAPTVRSASNKVKKKKASTRAVDSEKMKVARAGQERLPLA